METFVIRVWRPAEGETDSPLRGLVEHVRGERRPFEGPADLLAFLDTALRPPKPRAGSSEREPHSKGATNA